MRILEVRRHSMRKSGGGSQLSQEGVDYARALGATLGPYACVVASVVPRARETAIAMGFAVDYELVPLAADEATYAEMGESRWWLAASPFQALALLMVEKGALWRYGNAVAALWRDILTGISDGSAALLIGHSGELQIGVVACIPDTNYATWGAPFGHCEGARLIFDGEPAHFVNVELLRGGA